MEDRSLPRCLGGFDVSRRVYPQPVSLYGGSKKKKREEISKLFLQGEVPIILSCFIHLINYLRLSILYSNRPAFLKKIANQVYYVSQLGHHLGV